jgi:hypothetical protein
MGYVMTHYNYTMAGMNDIETFSFLQTYSLNQGLKRFGERGRKAAHKEVRQLHDRVIFEPIHIEDMTTLERKRAKASFSSPKSEMKQSRQGCVQTEALNEPTLLEKKQRILLRQQMLS